MPLLVRFAARSAVKQAAEARHSSRGVFTLPAVTRCNKSSDGTLQKATRRQPLVIARFRACEETELVESVFLIYADRSGC